MIKKNKSSLASIRTYYMQRAESYDSEAKWITDGELLRLHNAFFELNSGSTVLDLACGTGQVGHLFKNRGHVVIGLDLSRQMLNQAINRIDSKVQSAAESLPFRSSSFDLIVCRQGLHYMHLERAMAEAYRVTSSFILLSQIVCLDEDDAEWWNNVFRLLTPDRREIFTAVSLQELLLRSKFNYVAQKTYTETNTIKAWLKAIGSSKKTEEKVMSLMSNAPDGIATKYNFQFIGDGDFSYTQYWVLIGAQKNHS